MNNNRISADDNLLNNFKINANFNLKENNLCNI